MKIDGGKVEVVLSACKRPAMARAVLCREAGTMMNERVRHEWMVQPWVFGVLLKVSMN